MFCALINLSVGFMQVVIDVLYGFWGLFGIATPDMRASFGSIFGCNI